MTQHWTVMPNFVDCAVFRPVSTLAEKQALRQAHGIPPDALVVGCVAAVKKDHKRIDYLIREVGGVQSSKSKVERPEDTSHISPLTSHSSFLLIAGARTSETAELRALAESQVPGRHKILTDCKRSQMPALYQMMDVFVLPSLFEMMPIALLEAMASGLPCLVHPHPVLEWMVGEGSKMLDLGMGSKMLDVRCETSGSKTLDVRCETSDVRSERAAPHVSHLTSHVSPLPAPPCGLVLDMSRAGGLGAALAGLTGEWLVEHGRAARVRAEQMFSKEVVVRQYVEYYREVMGEGAGQTHLNCIKSR